MCRLRSLLVPGKQNYVPRVGRARQVVNEGTPSLTLSWNRKVICPRGAVSTKKQGEAPNGRAKVTAGRLGTRQLTQCHDLSAQATSLKNAGR